MKIRVTLKDPDTMPDAVDEAFAKVERPEGVEPDEWLDIRENRAGKVREQITDRFMEYSEYLVVEFDTDNWTARVVPCSEL